MIRSPCNNICRMDEKTGLCVGCLRTIDEIVSWRHLDDDERQLILTTVARRRNEIDPQPKPQATPHG